MKKPLALVLSLVLAMGTLAACGTPASSKADSAPAGDSTASTTASSEAKTQEDVTITVSTWDLASSGHMDKLLAAFKEEYPHITVEMIDVPGTEYNNKLNIMLNGGSELDAFWIKDASSTKAIYDKGQLEDLMPMVKQDNIDLSVYKGLDEFFTFDGKLVGLPFRSDYYILYYNKDLFDAAKMEYPTNDTTWAEFEEMAKKLTSGEGADKNYGALLHTWQACVQNWGVQGGKHTMMETDLTFFKPYYEMALRMQNEDKSIMDFATMKTANIHYSSPFLTGNVAMMPMGTWFMGTIISKINAGESSINWGVATLPHGDDVPAGSVVGATTPLCINPASTKKEAAWEFVKFASGPKGAAVLASAGNMPGIVNDDILKTLTSIDGMPEGTSEALKYTSIVLDRPITDKVEDVNKMLGEVHGLIMFGEKSIDEGLKEMSERSKEIQEDN